MKEHFLLSVIIPVYYEEAVVQTCYKELKRVMLKNKWQYEFVFVNDGSKDKTLELLREISKADMNVKVIDFSRNFGHQVAVTAGIFHCTGDVAVIIDADLQDPPHVIEEMVVKWKEGFDVV